MVKCPCGKNIVYKRTEDRPVDDENTPTGMYAPRPQHLYRAISSATPTKKERIYGCEDDMCMYTSEMTEAEFHELEEKQSDDLFQLRDG